jgi:hypothetical protein
MMKSITDTLLTSAMGFAYDLLNAGERVVAFAERWGVDEAYDLSAGFTERWIHNRGNAITAMGERLELGVNGLAMKLGYRDAEVSGMLLG